MTQPVTLSHCDYLFTPEVCAQVHAPGAECGVCNPVMVDGYSASPTYLAERLALKNPIEQKRTTTRAWWQANAIAQGLDARGDVPCTCADIRHAAYRMGDVPSAELLGWHYDACLRTVAALRETLQ